MKEKKEINVIIGDNIKREREKIGLTQERFSELIGINTKSLSTVECGTGGISLTTLQKICKVLAISSDAILFGELPDNDLDDLSRRLKRLPPEQYAIARDVLCKLLEAFALSGE